MTEQTLAKAFEALKIEARRLRAENDILRKEAAGHTKEAAGHAAEMQRVQRVLECFDRKEIQEVVAGRRRRPTQLTLAIAMGILFEGVQDGPFVEDSDMALRGLVRVKDKRKAGGTQELEESFRMPTKPHGRTGGPK